MGAKKFDGHGKILEKWWSKILSQKLDTKNLYGWKNDTLETGCKLFCTPFSVKNFSCLSSQTGIFAPSQTFFLHPVSDLEFFYWYNFIRPNFQLKTFYHHFPKIFPPLSMFRLFPKRCASVKEPEQIATCVHKIWIHLIPQNQPFCQQQ